MLSGLANRRAFQDAFGRLRAGQVHGRLRHRQFQGDQTTATAIPPAIRPLPRWLKNCPPFFGEAQPVCAHRWRRIRRVQLRCAFRGICGPRRNRPDPDRQTQDQRGRRRFRADRVRRCRKGAGAGEIRRELLECRQGALRRQRPAVATGSPCFCPSEDEAARAAPPAPETRTKAA